MQTTKILGRILTKNKNIKEVQNVIYISQILKKKKNVLFTYISNFTIKFQRTYSNNNKLIIEIKINKYAIHESAN